VSEANAEARQADEVEHGISIRSASELRADHRRDAHPDAKGWYGSGRLRSGQHSKQWSLWRPRWAKIAGPWQVPDYLRVSAEPQESPTT
jgi:hypothetical protein